MFNGAHLDLSQSLLSEGFRGISGGLEGSCRIEAPDRSPPSQPHGHLIMRVLVLHSTTSHTGHTTMPQSHELEGLLGLLSRLVSGHSSGTTKPAKLSALGFIMGFHVSELGRSK